MNYLNIIITLLDGSKKYDFANGIISSLISIAVVFVVLLIIILISSLVSLLINKLTKKETKKIEETKPSTESINIDTNDEDLMAAILVATIDYRNETKQNVKVISVKEIK